MAYILSYLIFYGIPLGSVAFFAVSLVRFCRAKKKNKLIPETFSPEEMRSRKTMLVVSSVILGILVAVVVGFTALLYMAVAYM